MIRKMRRKMDITTLSLTFLLLLPGLLNPVFASEGDPVTVDLTVKAEKDLASSEELEVKKSSDGESLVITQGDSEDSVEGLIIVITLKEEENPPEPLY